MTDKQVKKIGKHRFVATGAGTYSLQLSSDYAMSDFFNASAANWDGDPVSVHGVRVVPWGMSNNLPNVIRDVLERNNLGPGILERKTGLLYGQGPMLFRKQIVGNECVQEWAQDAEIEEWLNSWDYKRYIRNVFVEYTHMKGHFTKYYSGRSVRIGKPWVAKLECMHDSDCRLVWPENNSRRLEDVTQILTGDYETYRNMKLYPVFDKWNPSRHETSIRYHSMRSFGRNMYAISSFYGSIPWLENANNIPEIIKYLNENLIAAAYIVHEPSAYWEEKRNSIMYIHPEWEEARILSELELCKDAITSQIADVMAGKRNVGKFFTCVDFVDSDGNKQEWKIEPIEMNVDKYIEAQTKISRIADSSTTSGFGLNPALANIIIDGKGDSGSQMLYALKIFFGADTQIPEEIALEAINDAIRINFPNKKDLFLGIYRKIINKEDNVTADKRATNQA